MTIDSSYIKTFSNQVDVASPAELKKILCEGRVARLESGQKCHFWDCAQKKLHADFDKIYARGIEKLAASRSAETLPLTGRITSESPPSLALERAGQAAPIGLAAGAGWTIGWMYGNSMTNLIIHEYGHAWAINQISVDAHPQVTTDALYWLEHGDWSSWFWGVRDGAPGNFTSFGWPDQSSLSSFGETLSPAERDLFVSSAGLATELVANLSVAGLGLLAVGKKQYALGFGLLGFALNSHLSADGYILRTPWLLDAWTDQASGDPPAIASSLAAVLHCSPVEAFRLLYYGYLFLPIALIVGGLAAVLYFNRPEEVADDAVLMPFLTQHQTSLELGKIMAEVEIEMSPEFEGIHKLDETAQKNLRWKIRHTLITKIKENETTGPLFEKKRSELIIELKGKLGAATGFTFYLKLIASLAAFGAYLLRSISQTLIPALAKAFYYLTGIFIFAQGICLVLDCIQTAYDLCNEKFTALAKALSVSRTTLSFISLLLITLALFIPGLNALLLPVLISCTVLRLVLFGIHLYEMRRMAAEAAEPPPKQLTLI